MIENYISANFHTLGTSLMPKGFRFRVIVVCKRKWNQTKWDQTKWNQTKWSLQLWPLEINNEKRFKLCFLIGYYHWKRRPSGSSKTKTPDLIICELICCFNSWDFSRVNLPHILLCYSRQNIRTLDAFDLWLGLSDTITKNTFCIGYDSWVLSINNLCTLYFVPKIDSNSQ